MRAQLGYTRYIRHRGAYWAVALCVMLFFSGCFGMGSSGRLGSVSGIVRIDSGGAAAAAVTTSLQSSSITSVSGPSAGIRPAAWDGDFETTSNEFIVRVRSGTSAARVREIARESGFRYLRSSVPDFHLVLANGTDLKKAKDRLRGYREAISVEINGVVAPLSSNPEPNDLHANEQWALEQIQATLAWGAATRLGVNLQNRQVTVAVIDSGINFHHEDLNDPDLWVDGWDFTTSDVGEPYGYRDPGSGKAYFHGTMVAGIIGALTNNGKGVAGVARGTVRLMPIRVFGNEDPAAKVETLARAIDWALKNGANVMNLSLGDTCTDLTICPGAPEIIGNALERAWDMGVPVIAAAGNYSGAVIWPANHPTTIAVGASTVNGSLASYSSHGQDLNVIAPGGENILSSEDPCEISKTSNRKILGLDAGGGYCGRSGTSFAAPHVTGIVALMLARGAITDPADVMRTLEITAQRSQDEFDPKVGWGRVDAYGAVTGGVPLVFVGRVDGNALRRETPMAKAFGEGGRYQLHGIPEGDWLLFGWVDVDGDGAVSSGDYYGKSPLTMSKGKSYTGLNVTLQEYEGASLAVTE